MAALSSSDLRTRRSSPYNASAAGGAWLPDGGTFNDTGGSTYSGGSGYQSPASFNTGASPSYRSDASTRLDETKEPSIWQLSPELLGTLALLFMTALFLHADQNLAAPNLSAIASDFEMSPMQKDSRLGGLVQFGFFLIGGGVSIFIGPAADQFDRITVLCGVVLCGCIPSLLMSLFVPSSKAGFFYFFLARICTGVAIGGSFPVLFSLCADVFPASQRALISGAISAAGNIGAALGGLMSGIVGPRFGWRRPFTCCAVPALVCAILVRLFLTDPRTVQKAKARRDSTNEAFSAWMGGNEMIGEGHVSMADLDLSKFEKVFSVKSNRLVFMQALPGCVPISVIVTFLSDYLSTEQGMDVQASTAITAVFGVSCLCFGIMGGWLGQNFYNERRKDKFCLLVMAGMFTAAVPFMLLVNSSNEIVTSQKGRPTFLALFLAAWGGCAAVAGPNVRLVLMNVNPSERRGTVFSAFTLCDDLGKGLGPSVVVMLVSIFGRRTAFTMAFAGWWLSGAIMSQLGASLPGDAQRGGDSLLPTKKM